MDDIIYGFDKPDAEALKDSLSPGSPIERKRRDALPWRYFGKIATPIEAGASNGIFEIWDMKEDEATGYMIEDVKNPGAGTYPSDPDKIVGITRCAWSGIWILDLEYCQ